ncbi:transposase [Streptomyces sp. NPDC048845]|uniref:transposase n=1 Tax=Streptomyces sp. NPDC048845 TaxID=3155390 RepID=UPI0034386554
MDDDLWALTEPLLPPWPEKSPGARPVADRLCPQGILYVLHNDMDLATPAAGAGIRFRADLLAAPGAVAAGRNAAGERDSSRACVDGGPHIRAEKRKRERRHWFVAGRPTDDG